MGTKRQQIGVARMEYNDDGSIKEASFTPTLAITHSNELLEELSQVKCADQDTLKSHAELVLAAWFAKISDIELADREQAKIESEIVSCQKFENGNIQICEIKFFFTKF